MENKNKTIEQLQEELKAIKIEAKDANDAWFEMNNLIKEKLQQFIQELTTFKIDIAHLQTYRCAEYNAEHHNSSVYETSFSLHILKSDDVKDYDYGSTISGHIYDDHIALECYGLSYTMKSEDPTRIAAIQLVGKMYENEDVLCEVIEENRCDNIIMMDSQLQSRVYKLERQIRDMMFAEAERKQKTMIELAKNDIPNHKYLVWSKNGYIDCYKIIKTTPKQVVLEYFYWWKKYDENGNVTDRQIYSSKIKHQKIDEVARYIADGYYLFFDDLTEVVKFKEAE